MSHSADRLVSLKSGNRLFQTHGVEVSNVLSPEELCVRLMTSRTQVFLVL